MAVNSVDLLRWVGGRRQGITGNSCRSVVCVILAKPLHAVVNGSGPALFISKSVPLLGGLEG